MRKHPLRILIATMVVTYGLLLVTILAGGAPNLGLDLQGGIAVNLQPVENGKVIDNASSQDLDDAIQVIRRRVDALGVAEPEVARQGNTISVQLPGAKDQSEVLEVVGSTAKLEFRPVLEAVGMVPQGEARAEAEARVAELRQELGLPDGVTAEQVLIQEQVSGGDAGETEGATGEATPDAEAAPDEIPPAQDDADTTTGNGGGRSAATRIAATQDDTSTTTSPEEPATDEPSTDETSPTTSVPAEPRNEWGIDISSEQFQELFGLEMQLSAQITPPEERAADKEVTLATPEGAVYRLGPMVLDGKAIDNASSGLQGTEWAVSLSMRGGEDGIDKFNEIAAACYSGGPTCPGLAPDNTGVPRGQVAIVLDEEIISAPSINAPQFDRDGISISGSFNRESADALAVALRYGSLPIELQPQQAETVSATLGQGALQAGIIAGLIGLALASLYMILYYRLLAVVAIGSLTISASALWILMSVVGATVTLAGVVGIVVSVGITVDSTVVYFEGLKEYVRGGASMRAAVDRSFTNSYSTIIKANVASLIGAGVLYWLAVGPVRGFAFYLGAMTLLNLIATYTFVYPFTAVLGRSRLAGNPRLLGIPVDDLGRDAAPPKGSGPTAATVTGASS